MKFWKPKSTLLEIETFLGNISKFIKIADESEVRDFLISESFRMDSYFDVITKIIKLKRENFSDSAQLILQINHDPELNDEFLKFYIRQKSYPENFMENIYKIRAAYSKDLISKKVWIFLTTDFKPPI